MATRIQQLQLVQSPTFQAQVASCLLFAAVNVLTEANTTANHSTRLAYAKQIMQNPTVQASFLMNWMLTNPTIAANAGNAVSTSGTPIDDNSMDFVIASLFTQAAQMFTPPGS